VSSKRAHPPAEPGAGARRRILPGHQGAVADTSARRRSYARGVAARAFAFRVRVQARPEQSLSPRARSRDRAAGSAGSTRSAEPGRAAGQAGSRRRARNLPRRSRLNFQPERKRTGSMPRCVALQAESDARSRALLGSRGLHPDRMEQRPSTAPLPNGGGPSAPGGNERVRVPADVPRGRRAPLEDESRRLRTSQLEAERRTPRPIIRTGPAPVQPEASAEPKESALPAARPGAAERPRHLRPLRRERFLRER